MGEKLISVIIPVYNQLEYFKKCIESICNQTYRNLEIICVDDGSTDGVENLLDDITASDDRVIVIHQENSGESHARNVGLQKAKGDYIAFADCDDWIESGMYETLAQVMEHDGVDIVASGWFKDTDDKSIEIKNELPVEDGVFGKEQFLKYIYIRDSYRGFAYMWDKIYKREILTQDGRILLFDESKKLGADVIYLAQVALRANSCRYIDKGFYHYRIREGSGSHSKNIDLMKDWIESYKVTIKLLEENSVDSETIDYAKRFMAYHAMQGVKIARETGDVDGEHYFKKIMRENERVYTRLNKSHPERISEYNNLLNEE